MTAESIKAELDLHRGDLDEAHWLASKELIPTEESDYEINLLAEWHMPGSESYILEFEINSPERIKRLIAKACIKMAASATVQEWMERRRVIESAGVAVPKLYSVAGPDYIEEYIPLTFKEAYLTSSEEQRNSLRQHFFDTYTRVAELGFKPVTLHDARSRGQDVVLIDFGSDLGGRTDSAKDEKDALAMRIETDFRRILR